MKSIERTFQANKQTHSLTFIISMSEKSNEFTSFICILWQTVSRYINILIETDDKY